MLCLPFFSLLIRPLRFCASENSHRRSAANNSPQSLRCSRSSPRASALRVIIPLLHPLFLSPRTMRIILIQELTQKSILLEQRAPTRRAASRRNRSECNGRECRRPSSRAIRMYVRTYARMHARTHKNRVVTLSRATYVYFRRRKRDTRCTVRELADPSLPFKSRRRTASSHRVEIWEWWKRGRRGTEGDVVLCSVSGRERS